MHASFKTLLSSNLLQVLHLPKMPGGTSKKVVCLILTRLAAVFCKRNKLGILVELVVGFGPGPHWQGPGLADLPGYSVLVVDDGWPVCA